MKRLAVLCVFLASAAAGQTGWLGLPVEAEERCSPYDRGEYRYSQGIRDRILAGETGQDASPYSGDRFDSGGSWDIEHVVATSEAHDSGLCAAPPARRSEFASDLRNLTLARPALNRWEKAGKDAAEWLPGSAEGRCWFVRRVVEVKRAYELSVDAAESRALERVLLDGDCGSGPDDFMSYWSMVDPRSMRLWRSAFRAHRAGIREAERRARLARERAEFEALVASWRPPARVWRIGDLLFWTPPASGPMPKGYRVEQGGTVLHPWHRHDGREVYEHVLRGPAPARVEAEHGGGLSHRVYSPDVESAGDPSVLVQRVRYYASRSWRSAASRNRWRRVLAGFGVPCGVGHAGRPPVCGLSPAMRSEEAQEYADRGWSRWWQWSADALRRVEALGSGQEVP